MDFVFHVGAHGARLSRQTNSWRKSDPRGCRRARFRIRPRPGAGIPNSWWESTKSRMISVILRAFWNSVFEFFRRRMTLGIRRRRIKPDLDDFQRFSLSKASGRQGCCCDHPHGWFRRLFVESVAARTPRTLFATIRMPWHCRRARAASVRVCHVYYRMPEIG